MASRQHWKKNPAAIARLNRLLQLAPKEVEEEMTAALRKSGEEGKAIIRRDAPRDDGELEESVDWSFGDPPPGVLGAGDTASENSGIPARLRMSLFAGGRKAPHAHLVHFGTDNRVRDDGRGTGSTEPQPFFWPNVRSLRRRWRARVTRSGTKGLKRGLKN